MLRAVMTAGFQLSISACPIPGVDVVPELIDDLRGRPARDGISRTYLLADITRDPLPRAAAILCRDFLVHLSFARRFGRSSLIH